MTAFSPVSAAFEGFRVLRRQPKAVLIWTLLWLAALSVMAVVVASGDRVVVARHAPHRNLWEITRQFGPFAVVFIAMLLVIWASTTVATFRAVLQPERKESFFLRLSADELRLAIMTITAVGLVLVAGGAPAFLLFALVSPLMAAAPTFARDVATLGAVATVWLDIWLAVRLSLIAVETFAEGRFHLTAYWPLTRGRFWYLMASYAICFAIFFLFLIFFGLAGLLLGAVQNAVGLPVGLDLVRRTVLLGLAGFLALLTAGFFVVSTTLFCACQAHAFRAIVATHPADAART
ncbi:MAG TPA: hypothetical protein VII63_12955 [Caulobacteraceae bacterium]